MRRIVAAPAFVLGLTLLAACKKEPPPAPAPVASATPPVTSSVPAAPVAPSGHMAHCPSSVAGAVTTIADSPSGVTVTVSAKDPAAAAEVRARTQYLVQASKSTVAPIMHNGSGEGGGVFGRCPIVMRSTELAVTDVDGGSQIVVTPHNPKEQDWLRRESRDRLAALEALASQGEGKMAHCPAAVRGATMQVSEAKDAIVVTFTAKDDAAVKDIRDRGHKIAMAAKAGGATRKHDGMGDGGGGTGRCPVVLKDTVVDEKETPGGVAFNVKPKTASDLPALKKEILDRGAKFD